MGNIIIIIITIIIIIIIIILIIIIIVIIKRTLTLIMKMVRFGFEDEYYDGSVSWWQHTKPRIWSAFDEPYSSNFAKVNKL